GDPERYGGLGCRRAAASVNGEIAAAVCGDAFTHQWELDDRLIELDGTDNKRRLGANAILAVSLAFARTTAVVRQVPLYRHFADMAGLDLTRLPRPTINLFSGGKHAGSQVPIQDVLVVARSATTIEQSLATIWSVYQAAADLAWDRYAMRLLTADEGGLAPRFESVDRMFEMAVEAIEVAGLIPGRDVVLAVDVAASHFYQQSEYDLGDGPISSRQLIDTIAGWVDRFPIVSVEDGLGEDDWSHWPDLKRMLPSSSLVLGDDLLCTNPHRISQAIESDAANALLLKVNQIGTLKEADTARRLATEASWQVTVSARSGETEDDWLAGLATGWSGNQIKVGSITQSDRLAKYNRLLAIEAETHLPLDDWPA
ncbi:MAG: phosphopyruvate hydratase, partial [Pirellulales bacterium]